ncbi:hemolysin [Fusobacterium massiliense]|uniref:hemolysin n=2 Tax=Bacteria TaxID=2 RepID=UPI0028D82F72|nr:hemolysin [Fusobacterium massiliense]
MKKKKIETVVENLGNSNRFKEGIAGVELDKFKNERQKEFNLINDQNISLEDKRRIVQDLYRDFLRSKGYKGDIPEVILTDEENSFSVDSKDKETGEKRKERIFISINNLNNKDFSKVFVHELAHMNTYDEGYLGEETSLYTRSKLEPDDKTKVFSEADKEKYLESLRTKYPNTKSLEEQYAEAKLVPEKDREHWAVGISGNISLAFIGRVNFGVTDFYVYNENNGDKYYAESKDIGIGLGIPGAGISGSVVFLKNVNTSQEIDGYSFVSGASVTVLNGELIYDNKTKELAGIRIGISASVGVIPGFDLYGSVDSSILTKSKKLSDSQTVDQANLERNVNKLMKLANNKNEAQKNISEINNTILKIKNILERNKKRWK